MTATPEVFSRASSIRWRTIIAALFVLGVVCYVGFRVSKFWCGSDGISLYYGSRAILTGHNPYSDNSLNLVWQESHAPLEMQPGPPARQFIYPPLLAVLIPTGLLDWHIGMPAITWLSYGAGMLSAGLLASIGGKEWRGWQRGLLFSAILLLPALMRVLYFGQSTLIICACLAGALFAHSRGREILCGVLLAFALTKFTLTLPFILLFLYRREAKPVLIAFAVFATLNLLLFAPIGLAPALHDYAAQIKATSVAGGPNDPLAIHFDSQIAMIHLPELLRLLFGPNRVLIKVLTPLFGLTALLIAIWVTRAGARKEKAFANPLEIAVAMITALFLFYHRYYDLAALMFVGYGLLTYRLRFPDRQRIAWNMTFALFLTLGYLTSGTGISHPIDVVLKHLHLLTVEYYNPLLVALLFLACCYLLHRDRQIDNTSPALAA